MPSKVNPLTWGPFLFLLAGLSAGAQARIETPAVAVVTIPDVEAYAQTLDGIREQLPGVQVWDARDEGRLSENLKKPPRLAIAIGSTAAAALERLAPVPLTIIYTVALECDLENGAGSTPRLKTAVTVEIPPEILLGEIVRIFPGKRRIGIIRGAMQTDSYMKAVSQAASRIGLTVVVMNCEQARDLMEVFLKLRGRADLVWCPPNAQLYNSATLKPLLIASLTNRLPIIGFSDQFVHAGALFGGSADFVDVGRQTAALAIRVAQNEPVPPRQPARKFHFVYNQRVARLLGMKADVPEQAGGELVIIR